MSQNIFKASFFLACNIFLCSFLANGQQKLPKKEVLALEFGKTGIIFNLLYDHKFEGKKTGFRAGFGTNPGFHRRLKQVGGGIYYLAGKTKNFLELGTDLYFLKVTVPSDDQLGFGDLIYPDYPTSTYYWSLNIGYRTYGKILFRFGFSPGLIANDFVPGGYMSFGLLL